MESLQIPLNIPSVKILKAEYSKADDLIITVKSTEPSTCCRKCGKNIDKAHGYDNPIILRHLPILGKRVYIRIKPARYVCINCNDSPTTTEQAEWYNRRSNFTKAYEEYLMLTLINSTISDVAMKEGVSCESVEGALDRQIEKEVHWDEYSQLELLGLDEIALKKGHKDFVVIISTRIDGALKVIAILSDRKKNTVKSFLKGIPEHIRRTIKTVCSDMYDGYINSAKEVLGEKVKVVIDRFHVAKNYRKCVDKLRKEELRRPKKELSDVDYKKLKGAMWALRKKETNLTEEEKAVLNDLFVRSPSLKKAYKFEKLLTNIFNGNHNKKEASKQIKRWIKKVNSSSLDCFDKFISTLQAHWNEILNYFHRRSRKNSGFVEGLNNKIKTIKRRCYGIFNLENLYQRIQLDLGGYKKFA